MKLCREEFPDLKLLARAHNRRDAYELMLAGADFVSRETFDSSITAGREALKALGFDPHRAYRASQRFRRYDIKVLHELLPYARGDQSELIARAREINQNLEKIFETDEESGPDKARHLDWG